MKEFIDKTSESPGTPLNRESIMAIQGFENNLIVFENGKIIETNAQGHTYTTEFDIGSITETFVGERTITKRTIFHDDGSIEEVLL